MLKVDDEEAISTFKVHRNGTFGIEENLVIPFQGDKSIVFDLLGNGNDAAGDGGDFNVVGELNAAFGFLFVFVFADDDSFSQRLDGLGGPSFTHQETEELKKLDAR